MSVTRASLGLLLIVSLQGCRHPSARGEPEADAAASESTPDIPFCEAVTIDASGLPGGVAISSRWYSRCFWDGLRIDHSGDSELYLVAKLPTESCFPDCGDVLKISNEAIFERTKDDKPGNWRRIGRGRVGDIDRYQLYSAHWLTGMDWNLNGTGMTVDPAAGVPPTQQGVMRWVAPSGKNGEIHVKMEFTWMPSALVDHGPPPKWIVGCYEVSADKSMFASTRLELVNHRVIHSGSPWYTLASPSPQKKDARSDDIGDSGSSQRCSGWEMDGQTARIHLSNCHSGLSLTLSQRGSDLIGTGEEYWDMGGHTNRLPNVELRRVDCE
jgi:hypothetical protein